MPVFSHSLGHFSALRSPGASDCSGSSVALRAGIKRHIFKTNPKKLFKTNPKKRSAPSKRRGSRSNSDCSRLSGRAQSRIREYFSASSQCGPVGGTDTELIRHARVGRSPGLRERVLARASAGRWGVPDDLAGIAVFL